jgi:hypothetical protein
LHQVVRVRFLEVELVGVGKQQGGVQRDEAGPGLRLGIVAEAFKQADRGGVHQAILVLGEIVVL